MQDMSILNKRFKKKIIITLTTPDVFIDKLKWNKQQLNL